MTDFMKVYTVNPDKLFQLEIIKATNLLELIK